MTKVPNYAAIFEPGDEFLDTGGKVFTLLRIEDDTFHFDGDVAMTGASGYQTHLQGKTVFEWLHLGWLEFRRKQRVQEHVLTEAQALVFAAVKERIGQKFSEGPDTGWRELGDALQEVLGDLGIGTLRHNGETVWTKP